jgi:DNA-binding transcriptional LysR family regulator
MARDLDLNLLVALDALLSERHVTRAARRLGVRQPAMSRTLARLRVIFGDPLLVRAASGLARTPRGEEISSVAHDLVGRARGLFHPSEKRFDPSTSRRRFTVAGNEYAALVVLPRLAAHLARAAPGVRLVLPSAAPRDVLVQLDEGTIDLAVAPGGASPEALLRRALLEDRYVCAVGPRCRLPAPQRLDAARFAALRHVLVSPRGLDRVRFASEEALATAGGSAVDEALARQGHRRNIVVATPHLAVAVRMITEGDLVAVMPERAARALGGPRLRLVELPFDIPKLKIAQLWHPRADREAGARWLRGQLAYVAQRL